MLFDSFRGLSAPASLEALYAPDFTEGSYSSNQQTFELLAIFCQFDMSRIKIIPGFYEKSLVGKRPEFYGIEKNSISACFIDCDLLEPAGQVLEFVYEALEPGALIFFDDWRLCRASPDVGVRAATLNWMKRHRDIDLVEFDRPNWQSQWFIFHRRKRWVTGFRAPFGSIARP